MVSRACGVLWGPLLWGHDSGRHHEKAPLGTVAVVCDPSKKPYAICARSPLQVTPPHPIPITTLPHFLGSGLWALRYVLGGSLGKESACRIGDPGSIPGWGRPPGEGNGNPLQHPCLENLMDLGAWWAAVHGVTKRWA